MLRHSEVTTSLRLLASALAPRLPAKLHINRLHLTSSIQPYRSFEAFVAHSSHIRHFVTDATTSTAPATPPATNNEHADGMSISPSCIRRIKQVNQKSNKDQKLRVVVEGGGCHGFRYDFVYTDQVNEDDIVFNQDGATVVVDSVSYDLIKGSTIDWEEDIFRSSFVMSNPNADAGCSCGTSFNIK